MKKILALLAILLVARAVAMKGAQCKFTTDANFRYCDSNGLPQHTPGAFPNAHNPNTIAPQHHQYRMPRNPTRLLTPVYSAPMVFGVALDGVPFDPGTAERNGPLHYEALGGSLDLGLDKSNAHVQPSGSYHYHAMPLPVIRNGFQMCLVGYAADGFPIYNDRDLDTHKIRSSFHLRKIPRRDGSRPDGTYTEDYEWQEGELDLCNGHWGRTPEFPGGSYHYHCTENFPFIPRRFAGAPDPSFARR